MLKIHWCHTFSTKPCPVQQIMSNLLHFLIVHLILNVNASKVLFSRKFLYYCINLLVNIHVIYVSVFVNLCSVKKGTGYFLPGHYQVIVWMFPLTLKHNASAKCKILNKGNTPVNNKYRQCVYINIVHCGLFYSVSAVKYLMYLNFNHA